ncbi:MAG: GNAT family N-acetyltransferase [Saprospiraceae bacterium]
MQVIRPLKTNDINGLNALTPVEWKFEYESFLKNFIDEPFFYAFLLLQENNIVGTGNVLIKGNIGWLANIIVDYNHRNLGLGFSMTKFLVDFLQDKGCETQILIATKLGEPVYQKIGFKKITEYYCYDSVRDVPYANSDFIRPLTLENKSLVYNLDYMANGENRSHLINKFYKNGFGYFDTGDLLLGFYLPEFGKGLVISSDPTAGKELLKLKHATKGRRTMLPIENEEGIKTLENLGLTKGISSSKMILGKLNFWNPSCIYSYGSGYCG